MNRGERFLLSSVLTLLAVQIVWAPIRNELRASEAAPCIPSIGFDGHGQGVLHYKISDALPADWKSAINSAAQRWNSQRLTFQLVPDPNSKNEIGFDRKQQKYFDDFQQVFGGPTIALTRKTYKEDTLLEIGTILNMNSKFSTKPQGVAAKEYDLESVMMHEFGHWAGLEHPYDKCGGRSVMAPIKKFGMPRRQLFEGDRLALSRIYPGKS